MLAVTGVAPARSAATRNDTFTTSSAANSTIGGTRRRSRPMAIAAISAAGSTTRHDDTASACSGVRRIVCNTARAHNAHSTARRSGRWRADDGAIAASTGSVHCGSASQ